MAQLLCKSRRAGPPSLKIEWLCGPVVPLLDVCPKDLKTKDSNTLRYPHSHQQALLSSEERVDKRLPQAEGLRQEGHPNLGYHRTKLEPM